MPACSISTTGIRRTRTTTSASADPRNNTRAGGLQPAAEAPFLGRKSPASQDAKARAATAKPKTASGPTGVDAGSGSEFYRLTSFTNLWECWRKAKLNKSGSIRIQRFGEDPMRHILTIQERLRAGTFQFGPYKCFEVQERKHRVVVDAPMKDRIVHWMLYRYLLPIWQPRFIADTYGNLPGRGTHAAVQRLAQFCRAGDAKYVLQMDISKYFYSVNHDILKERARRYVGDHKLRVLIERLIDSFVTDSRFDDLFAPGSAYRTTLRKGMPIGNLSSQLFANIYLSDFDHWVKETLGVKRYIRYVDDQVITGQTKEELQGLCELIVARMAADGLTIHPKKIRLAPVRAGVPFLGYVVWPNHISVGAYGRKRFLHRLRQHETGGFDKSEALTSYAAMFSHTGSTIYRAAV